MTGPNETLNREVQAEQAGAAQSEAQPEAAQGAAQAGTVPAETSQAQAEAPKDSVWTRVKRFLTEDRPPRPDSRDPDKKVFAKGWNFIKVFTFFVIGCVVGTYYEEILWYVRFHEWVDRQGIFYGPFSPIYGLGFAIFIIFLGRRAYERSWLKTYLWSALIGGCTEYVTSLIAEKLLGSTIWDYHDLPLNIDGRTTIPFMLFWGLGGLVLVKVLYPPISRLIEKLPPIAGRVIYTLAITLMALDLILSYGAMGRRAMRDLGQPPATFIGEFFDRVYPDEYIQQKIPAMVVTEERPGQSQSPEP